MMSRERQNIRKFNLKLNMEREKRKVEWKKLDVLARQQLAGERVDTIKQEKALLAKSKSEQVIIRSLERERLEKAMTKLKGANIFSKQTQEYVERNIPDIQTEPIFKPRENKKKKA